MDEFNTRINAQRQVLEVINSKVIAEPLFGLSKKAIDRWVTNNQLVSTNPIIDALTEISGKLLFLANKSQQQITAEYKTVSLEVNRLTGKLSSMWN